MLPADADPGSCFGRDPTKRKEVPYQMILSHRHSRVRENPGDVSLPSQG